MSKEDESFHLFELILGPEVEVNTNGDNVKVETNEDHS